eukprot:jgi/Bigna1/81405/fgenesh1_pg.80_\
MTLRLGKSDSCPRSPVPQILPFIPKNEGSCGVRTVDGGLGAEEPIKEYENPQQITDEHLPRHIPNDTTAVMSSGRRQPTDDRRFQEHFRHEQPPQRVSQQQPLSGITPQRSHSHHYLPENRQNQFHAFHSPLLSSLNKHQLQEHGGNPQAAQSPVRSPPLENSDNKITAPLKEQLTLSLAYDKRRNGFQFTWEGSGQPCSEALPPRNSICSSRGRENTKLPTLPPVSPKNRRVSSNNKEEIAVVTAMNSEQSATTFTKARKKREAVKTSIDPEILANRAITKQKQLIKDRYESPLSRACGFSAANALGGLDRKLGRGERHHNIAAKIKVDGRQLPKKRKLEDTRDVVEERAGRRGEGRKGGGGSPKNNDGKGNRCCSGCCCCDSASVRSTVVAGSDESGWGMLPVLRKEDGDDRSVFTFSGLYDSTVRLTIEDRKLRLYGSISRRDQERDDNVIGGVHYQVQYTCSFDLAANVDLSRISAVMMGGDGELIVVVPKCHVPVPRPSSSSSSSSSASKLEEHKARRGEGENTVAKIHLNRKGNAAVQPKQHQKAMEGGEASGCKRMKGGHHNARSLVVGRDK